jgi:hypothetical protein
MDRGDELAQWQQPFQLSIRRGPLKAFGASSANLRIRLDEASVDPPCLEDLASVELDGKTRLRYGTSVDCRRGGVADR